MNDRNEYDSQSEGKCKKNLVTVMFVVCILCCKGGGSETGPVKSHLPVSCFFFCANGLNLCFIERKMDKEFHRSCFIFFEALLNEL